MQMMMLQSWSSLHQNVFSLRPEKDLILSFFSLQLHLFKSRKRFLALVSSFNYDLHYTFASLVLITGFFLPFFCDR